MFRLTGISTSTFKITGLALLVGGLTGAVTLVAITPGRAPHTPPPAAPGAHRPTNAVLGLTAQGTPSATPTLAPEPTQSSRTTTPTSQVAAQPAMAAPVTTPSAQQPPGSNSSPVTTPPPVGIVITATPLQSHGLCSHAHSFHWNNRERYRRQRAELPSEPRPQLVRQRNHTGQ